MVNSDLLGTKEASAALGCSPNTFRLMCLKHPGFAFLFHQAWRVPRAHVEAVMRGERVEDIARKAREGVAARAA